MAKFYNIEEDDLKRMNELMNRKIDNEFIVLSEYNGITDICQYSSKFQNLHIVSVPNARLDWKYRIA